MGGMRPIHPFSAQKRSRKAVAIESPDRIGNRVQDAINFSIFFALHQRGEARKNLRALVLHAAGGTAATTAWHVPPNARRIAARASGWPHAYQSLGQQAGLLVDDQVLRPLEFGDG